MNSRDRQTLNTFFWIDLKDAVQRGGCPVCAMLERSTLRYLRGFLHENVLDVGLRVKLVESHGFCNAHGYALLRVAMEMGEALGVATVYEHLTQEVRDQIRQTLDALLSLTGETRRRLRRQRLGEEAARKIQAKRHCPVCEHAAEWERSSVRQLVEHLADSQDGGQVRQMYAQSGGLCLPHLRRALCEADSDDVIRFLLQTQIGKLEQLHSELSEFCRKHDYRFRHEAMTEGEETVWARVIEAFTGKREVPSNEP